ncbi:MAG: right-handed parallel beta-helix repeat-containing protein, partial [Sedimentisphaerales bacterium]|nr:right-handed parallel beta-helix repeat-containing protein [Sedimentisphaerales bacterium]
MVISAAQLWTCLLISMFLPVLAGTTLAGQIIYVDGDAAGAIDGSSWANAYNRLQDALGAASEGDEIRVAQGVYAPDQGGGNTPGDREATFQLISGVAIYGGYAGYGEPDPDARDVREFETVLSGDLLGNDFAKALPVEYVTERTRAENSYNVVTAGDTDETAVLDGFTIKAGYADGSYPYCGGGGMCNSGDGATLVNCTFTGNWATAYGGAIWNRYRSALVATNCRFTSNCAGRPGSGIGGAVDHDGGEAVRFINCSFTGNLTSEAGGAIHGYGDMTLINCTFCGNSAGYGDAGAVSVSNGDAIVTNCIFWGNWDENGAGQSAQIGGWKPIIKVNFCCIQGWNGDLGGIGNTGADPLLADADGADNVFGTIDDNPRLLPGSTCLNAGDNASVPDGLVSDLDGSTRITDGVVDIGAFEGENQAILLGTESLTVPEAGTNSFDVSLAMDPQTRVEITVVFESGDADITVVSGDTLFFDSTDYWMPQTVTVSAAEDQDYLNSAALIRAEGGGLRPVGVTVREQDNEPTTGIVLVDDDATGSGDGMTWVKAYNCLQDALQIAISNPQIWEIRVARGIYRPDEGSRMVPGDRIAAFHPANGVTIKGGYAGLGAADPDDRNVKLYETVLSGDLAGDDDGFSNNAENSYHVVYSIYSGGAIDETAVLDGLAITGGNANGEFDYGYLGGGMFNGSSSSPMLQNCTFTGNLAAFRGGGMYSIYSRPTLTGCTFSRNFAGSEGGGIYIHHECPTLSNCVIANNSAVLNGGGLAADDLYVNDLVLTNCTIADNEAAEYGGGIYVHSGALYLTNCILWG